MGTYLYEGQHRYNPEDHQHDESYIPIDPGDQLEVIMPLEFPIEGTMEQPTGWLKGRNLTKNVSGLFPGNPYVLFVRRSSVSRISPRKPSHSEKVPDDMCSYFGLQSTSS